MSILFTDIKYFSHSEKAYNEDAYGIGPNYMFVLDGATGLGKKEIMHPHSDAYWFVSEIKEHLISTLKDGPFQVSLLKQKRAQLYAQYQKAGGNQLSSAEMPSACIALFYEDGEDLCFFGMGDCYGIVELMDGTIEIYSDPILESLDQKAMTRMKEISQEKQIPFLEARKYIQDLLLANRKMRNQPNGYHALDLEWDHYEQIPIHRWKLNNVKRVLAASDGFYEIMHYNIIHTTKELLDLLSSDSKQTIQLLFDAQDNDPQAILCPRFKHRDDCTFMYRKISKLF